MVKKFRGQVKISDVQEAFDKIINRINSMVESYNNSDWVKDIDYTVGGDTLAPAGYSLTVGGLKQLMTAMDGLVVGAKPIRINSNTVKMTDGVLITKDGFHRLPQKSISPISGKTIYYNTVSKKYQWTGAGSNLVKVPISYSLEKDIHFAGNSSRKGKSFKGYKLGYETYTTPAENLGFGMRVNGSDNNINVELYKASSLKDNNTSLILNPKYYFGIGGIVEDSSIITIPYEDGVWNKGILLGKFDSVTSEYVPAFMLRFGTIDYSSGFKLIVNGNSNTLFYDSSNKYVRCEMSYIDSISKKISTYDISTIDKLQFTFGKDPITQNPCVNLNLLKEDGSVMLTMSCQIPQSVNNYGINYIVFSTGKLAVFTQEGNTPSQDPLDSRDCVDAESYTLLTNGEVYKMSETNSMTDYTYELVQSKDAAYRICDINMKRDSVFCSDLAHAQVEGINGTFKITSQTKWKKPVAEKPTDAPGGEKVDTSNAPKFVAGLEEFQLEGQGTAYLKLLNTVVAWNRQPGHRNLNAWTPINKLFVPKGVDNPWSYERAKDNMTKVFNVIINKNISQEEEDK